MNAKKYETLFVELEMYEQSGVSFKIDDQPASPMQIVTAHMVKEDQTYMRDYVWDEMGQVKELTFHSIKNR